MLARDTSLSHLLCSQCLASRAMQREGGGCKSSRVNARAWGTKPVARRSRWTKRRGHNPPNICAPLQILLPRNRMLERRSDGGESTGSPLLHVQIFRRPLEAPQPAWASPSSSKTGGLEQGQKLVRSTLLQIHWSTSVYIAYESP